MRSFQIGDRIYAQDSLFIICGPCVIESAEHCHFLAGALKEIAGELDLEIIFKASFDKANRTSGNAYRGPGLEKGLEILSEIRRTAGLPVLTDIHEAAQAPLAAQCVDILQIPAFLCRQTDLILAAAETGRALNIKKGQFLSPWEMRHVVEKARARGNSNLILTERGSSFGYNNLVVDFRSLPILQELGHPVVLDVTHSLQLPGGAGGASGGLPQFIPHLARAAVAAGADGLFFEVHENPAAALSDGANALRLADLKPLLKVLLELHALLVRHRGDENG
jgi:2-dehydro-3-deoxyphosphooctonate aldolase (KDO 8-P synthase)